MISTSMKHTLLILIKTGIEYLSLCLEYKKALYYAGYDGYKMNKVFNDYGEKLTVFLDKYPNFHLKSQVKKDIRAYKGF